jgi:hypothetical protein
MNQLMKVVIGLTLFTSALSYPLQVFAAEVDEEAVTILKRSTAFMAKATEFKITTEFGFDVVQETGQKLEFGAHHEVTIRRPDKAHLEFSRRDGVQGRMVFDGKQIVVLDPDEKVYSLEEIKGDVDTAFDFLVEELQMPIPLDDFFSSDPAKSLAANLESGYVVGESEVAGISCDHLALRNARVDFQIWIARGDKPLPRRIVITYKNEEGQPQFWANFLEWDLAPHVPDNLFSTKPPEGATQIPFVIIDPSLNDGRGTR